MQENKLRAPTGSYYGELYDHFMMYHNVIILEIKRTINENESIEAFSHLSFPFDYSKTKTNVLVICVEALEDLARAQLIWEPPENWIN